MNILILNVGSSSIKYSVFQNTKEMFSKKIEKVSIKKEKYYFYLQTLKNIKKEIYLKNIEINRIGHRIVHGGEIRKTCKITPSIFKQIKKFAVLAPLHQYNEMMAIKICAKLFPKINQYVVFDSCFYHDMPKLAKMYALPHSLFEQGIKRYGFHGISHKYIATLTKGKVISCHLGNGCSVTAIKNKKAIDTSMGFTPLEGLMMGTRAGNFDPSIIFYLHKNNKMSFKKIYDMINKESGLFGVSEKSNDFRDLIYSKNKKAQLAVDLFVYNVSKYIGAYISVLDGVDQIVFTGGIGQNSSQAREKILQNFSYLGIKLDRNKNRKNERIISSKNSKIQALCIPANEKLMMTKEILAIKD